MKTVNDIMNRELLYLAEGTRAELAREPILRFGVTAVPVLDEDERPVGIVSLRDFVAGDGHAEASSPVFTLPTGTSVQAAALALAATDHHHAVIVDGAGRAIGMLSALDLLRAYVGIAPQHPAAFPAFRGKAAARAT